MKQNNEISRKNVCNEKRNDFNILLWIHLLFSKMFLAVHIKEEKQIQPAKHNKINKSVSRKKLWYERTGSKLSIFLSIFCVLLFLVSGCNGCSFAKATPTTALSESFDGTTFPPTNWARWVGSGSYNWARTTSGSHPTQSPHSGAGEAYYDAYDASSGSNAVLATPNLNLPQKSNVTLSFWMYRDTGYPTYNDKIEIHYSTTSQTTLGPLVTTFSRYATSNYWDHKTNIYLGVFSGVLYVQFRAVSAYGNCLFMDDVLIQYNNPPGTPVLDSQQQMDGALVPTTQPRLKWSVPTDLNGDNLNFRIQVATDTAFTNLLVNKLSTTPTGFGGSPNSPPNYTQGVGVAWYDVQAGDGLVNGNTYWWRVCAYDGTVYGDWTLARSFTIDTSQYKTGWKQTTSDQFASDTFVNTHTRGSPNNDVVLNSSSPTGEGMIAYGEYNTPTPKYRLWTGSAWGSAQNALSIGADVVYLVLKACPTRNEYALGTLDFNGYVKVQIYNGSTGTWGNLKTLATNCYYNAYRGFDLAYGSYSGNLVAVVDNSTANPMYYVWDGKTWTTNGTAISISTSNYPIWIEMKSNPKSDEVVLAVEDGSYELFSAVWNGNAWGNIIQLETNVNGRNGQSFDIAYESQSGRAMVIWAYLYNTNLYYRLWSGTAWSSESSLSLGSSYYVYWVRLSPDPSSNKMVLGVYDNDQSYVYGKGDIWSGTAWGTISIRYSSAYYSNPIDSKRIDTAFEKSGTASMLVWGIGGDGNGNVYTPLYSLYTSSWQSYQAAQSISAYPRVIQLMPNPSSDDVMLATGDNSEHLNAQRWTGSAWTGNTLLSSNLASIYTDNYAYEGFMYAYRTCFIGTGTVTSPPINFTSTPDTPYSWGEVKWNVSIGANGGSIAVRVQYKNGNNWTDIPGKSSNNTAIPIDLSDLNTTTYGLIRLVATLVSGTSGNPALEDWTVTWNNPHPFPYEDNMETTGCWTHKAISGTDDWALGVPTSGPNSDHTGGSNTNCWATSLAGTPATNSERWLQSPLIAIPSGLSTGTKVYVSYWTWYSMGSGDSAVVQASTDDGNTWSTTLQTYYTNTSSYVWVREVFEVNVSSTPADLLIRFTLTTDSSSAGTQWYIDDFKVNYGVEITKVNSYSQVANSGSLLTQSFDGTTFPPTNWASWIGSGSYYWSRTTAGSHPTQSPHSGAGEAYYDSYDASAGSNAGLATPNLNVPTNSVVTLTFWMYHNTGSSAHDDQVSVYYSTSSQTTYGTLVTTYHRYDGSSGWKQNANITIGTFTGTLYLQFKALSAYGYNVFIDDVSVSYSQATTNLQNESVQLFNYAPATMNLTGWKLQDYYGNSISLNKSGSWLGLINPGATVTIWTKTGTNNANNLYKNSATQMWIDTGDAVYLTDNKGMGVDFVRYGNSTAMPPNNLEWTGNNPTAPANTSQYIYRLKEGTTPNIDTDDGSNWVLWKDSNGDGVPDWWTTKYGLTGQNLATHDANNNGISDLNEYLNNLDPTSNVVFNMPVFLNTGLTLQNNAKLVLNRSSLTLNCTTDGQYAVNVTSAGVLNMANSTVTSAVAGKNIKFAAYGWLNMTDSSVSNLWSSQSLGIGGVMVYSNHVNLVRTTVMNSYTGIYLKSSNAVIKNSRISNTTYGIIVNTSATPQILRTNIDSNLTGIKVIGSGSENPKIDGNTVTTLNGEGMKLTNSKGYIANNTVKSEANNGLVVQSCSQAVVRNNIITGNQYGLFLNASTSMNIYSNTINGTDFGIAVIGSSGRINNTNINSIANTSLYLSNSSPTIANTTIAAATNASVKCTQSSSPRIENCTLLGYDYTLWVNTGCTPKLYKVDYQRSKVYVQNTSDPINDGIPYWAKVYRYGLDPTIHDHWADTNGNGISNVNETDLYDCDPTNASDLILNPSTCWGQMNNSVQTITSTGNSTQPVMVFDNNNTLHMAYIYMDSSGVKSIKYQKSINGGANWTAPVTITNVTDNPMHLSLAYDNNTDMLSIAWEENNIYDNSKPSKFVKYMTGKPRTDDSNPFSYPILLLNYSTSAFRNATVWQSTDVSNNEVRLNYTEDSATETVFSTNKTYTISTNTETYGQTFTAVKDFDKVGLLATSNNNIGTLNIILYSDISRATQIGHHSFVNFTDSSWLDFTVPHQPPGTYYLEWSRSNTSQGVGAKALSPGTYSGGSGYKNGTSQTYDFMVRWYTVTYIQSGELISRGYTVSSAIDRATVSWNSTILSGTTLNVQVSNDNGVSYQTASNHQIVMFTSSSSVLKYKITMTSSGANTPTLRWLQIDQSTLDYGINPSITGGNGNLYVTYQPLSVNHVDQKNLTFAKSVNNGIAWSYHIFDDSSSSQECSIPKITINGNKLYVVFLYFIYGAPPNSGGPIESFTSYNNGTSWGGRTDIVGNDIWGITDPNALSITTSGNNLITAYSSTETGESEIYSIYGVDRGSGSGLLMSTTKQGHSLPHTAIHPAIATDTIGNVYLSWSQTFNATYLQVTNASGESTLLSNTIITNYRNHPDLLVIATDKSDEVHLIWNETVNGKESIKSWNNIPHVPAMMAGAINNYLNMTSDSAFKDHAGERRIGLESRVQIVANQLNTGNWKKALEDLQYRTDYKVTQNNKAWIIDKTAIQVSENRIQGLSNIASNSIKASLRTQYGSAIVPTDWAFWWGRKDSTGGVYYNHVITLDSSNNGDFGFQGVGGNYNYVEFINMNIHASPINIDRFSMLSFESWSLGSIDTIRIEAQIDPMDGSGYQWPYWDTSTTHRQDSINLFASPRLGWNLPSSPYYSKTLQLINLWVILYTTSPGTIWQGGEVQHLFIGPSAWKNEFDRNDAKEWPFLMNGVPPTSDGDVARLFVTNLPGNVGAQWNYKSASGIDLPILLNDKQIYWKFKTDSNTWANIHFNIQGEYAGKIWSGIIYPFKGQQEEDSSSNICTNGLWQIRTISWNNIGDIISYSNSHLIDLTKNIWIKGIYINNGLETYTSQRNLWIDYLYISEDLDSDGISDIHSNDVNGDGILNIDAVTYGAFSVFTNPITSKSPTPIGLGSSQYQASFDFGSIQGIKETNFWKSDSDKGYPTDFYDPFEWDPHNVPFTLSNQDPVTIDTPEKFGRFQDNHPDIIHFDNSALVTQFNGYESWMICTPDPWGYADYENPFISAYDGKNWNLIHIEINNILRDPAYLQVPSEVTAIDPSKTVCGHLCDPELVYNSQNHNLYAFWVAGAYYYKDPSTGAVTDYNSPDFPYYWHSQSYDGFHWTYPMSDHVDFPQVSTPSTYKYAADASPTITFDDGVWKMWAVAPFDGTVRYYTGYQNPYIPGKLGGSFIWTYQQDCTGVASDGEVPWHIQIQKLTNGKYWGLVTQSEPQHLSWWGTRLYFITSDDGISWTSYDSPILSQRGPTYWDSYSIYRSAFTIVNGYLSVWYSGHGDYFLHNPVEAGAGWYIGLTEKDVSSFIGTATSDNYIL